MGTPLSTTHWTAVGPAPVNNGPGNLLVSGRIEGVVPHPTIANRIFAAGQNGGIWRTDDGGTSWTALTDSEPSLEFNGYHQLQMNPGNADIIVGGLGSPNGGLLISQNGGTSWTYATITSNDDVRGLGFDPVLANTIYVANGWNGVFKSTDLGTTWTQLTLPGGYFSDLIVTPSGAIYTALLGNGGGAASQNGLYRSVDGGTTWTQLSSSALPSGTALGGGSAARLAFGVHIFFTHVGRYEQVYATFLPVDVNGNVTGVTRATSADSGATWTALAPSPGNLENRSWHLLIAVAPLNPNLVFVNDAYALYMSYDGGQTWNAANTPGWDYVNLAFGADATVYATADQGLLSYNLNTQQAASLVGDLEVTQFYTVALDAQNPQNVYGVAQDLGALKSTGSASWVNVPGGEIGKFLVDPTNSSNVYNYNPTSSGSFVTQSLDGYQTQATILTDAQAGVQAGYGVAYATQYAFVMDPQNSKRLALGTTKVFVTDDATVATPVWNTIGGVLSSAGGVDQFIQALAIAPSNSNVFYAATQDGHAWNSVDGSTWQACDDGMWGNANGAIADLRVDPSDAAHVFAVTGGGGKGVWELVAGTWQNRTGNLPTDLGNNTIYVDWTFSTPVLYVGTGRGVYSSVDGGTTWSVFAQGLPNTQVNNLQGILQWRPSRFFERQTQLCAVTYGRGAWMIMLNSAPLGWPWWRKLAPAQLQAGLLSQPPANLPINVGVTNVPVQVGENNGIHRVALRN
ncbi:MAG TPA: hypothetical protein VMF11_07150 [Candidatus Baltobacteraceae bacterium]|nr:hypothetical protein [Candidatus Baltobacteraceae bacterium]